MILSLGWSALHFTAEQKNQVMRLTHTAERTMRQRRKLGSFRCLKEKPNLTQLQENLLRVTEPWWDVRKQKGKGRWDGDGQKLRSGAGIRALTLGNGGGGVGGVRQLVGGQSRHSCRREAPRQQVVESRKLVRSCLFAPSRSAVAEPHLMGRAETTGD